MHTITHTELTQQILHIASGLQIPLMIWGQPGVGKSDAIKQAAAIEGALVVDIRLSQYDSVDLRGLPSLDDDTTVWNMPSTIPFVGNDAFPDDKLIYLFFDEINSAMPSVMAVAYQIVLDRACGEHVLKPNVRIMAAGNREGDKGVTNKMPLPLADRFCHVELGVSADALIDYMVRQNAPAELIGFMSFRKPLASTFDPTKPDKVFATPRSWMRVAKVFAAPIPDTAKHTAIAGIVGEGPAVEFWQFVEVMSKIVPISRILSDPMTAPLPDELSMAYATAVSVSGAMTVQTVPVLQKYLQRMDAEMMVMAWQLATKRDSQIDTTAEFVAMARAHHTLFRGV